MSLKWMTFSTWLQILNVLEVDDVFYVVAGLNDIVFEVYDVFYVVAG